MQDEYILVVGGAGYIGSHTNLTLYESGYKTVVFDSLVHGHRDLVKCGEFVMGDLNSEDDINAVFANYRIDTVIHFAAYAYVGESVMDPQKYYINNVSNTLNLLRTMMKHGVKKVVFSSTCAIYGIPEQVPIDEFAKTEPINPYGQGKLMVENILFDYSKAYGLKYVSLRYFNAAGADPQGRIGERHSPETHLIPLAIRAVVHPGSPLVIFGTDYETPDGTCVRDYIHVSDLAKAHVLALEHLANDGSSAVFNLGNSRGHSVLEVINSIEKVTGQKVNYRLADRRPGDPPILVGDSNKIAKELAWKPEYSSLDFIISTAWNWHGKHDENNPEA